MPQTTQSLLPGTEELNALWDPRAVKTYVDSASYGLPLRATVDALREAITAWQRASADRVLDWDQPADEARALAATLLTCDVAEVALIPAVSVAVGVIAASLSRDDSVVVPDDEFASVSGACLFPPLQQRGRRAPRLAEVLSDVVTPGSSEIDGRRVTLSNEGDAS